LEKHFKIRFNLYQIFCVTHIIGVEVTNGDAII